MGIARLKQPNARGSAPTIFRISIVAIVILAILISIPNVQAGSSITHRSIAGWVEDVFSDGSFFSAHYLTIIDYSTLPDEWKAIDQYERYRHYYHVDVPHTREQYSEGVLPWTVDDNFSMLVQSLQTGNWDVAAQLFGVISHYICDASIPLHATQNYSPGESMGPSSGR